MREKTKKIVSLIALTAFSVQMVPRPVLADWLCPSTMISFDLAATCDAGCDIGCIESGTLNCGYTDDDGNAAFLPCVDNALMCPIGDFQCYEGRCRQFGECTSSSSDYTTHYCPLTDKSFVSEAECTDTCFYQSYICSETKALFPGADPVTGEIIPVSDVYNSCVSDCYSCPAGMYLFEPQSLCIQQTCDPGDPYCDLEVSRTDPLCSNGVGFVFDPDRNICVKPVDYTYTDCTAVTTKEIAYKCPDDGKIYEGTDAATRCDYYCNLACLKVNFTVPTGEYQCPLSTVSSIFTTEEICRFNCNTTVCDEGSVQAEECVYAPICDAGVFNPETKKCEEVLVATVAPTSGDCVPFDVQMACETYYSHSDQWLCKENGVTYTEPSECKDACADDNNCVGITSVGDAIQAYMRMDNYAEFPSLEDCQADVSSFCDSTCDPTGKCVLHTYADGITPDDWQRLDTLDLYATQELCEQSFRADCVAACEPTISCQAITRDDSADWTCDLDGIRYAAEDECKSNCMNAAACVVSPNPLCPLGSRLPCYDLGVPSTYTEFDSDSSFATYQDDGAVAPDGTCLGQIFLFNGLVSECKPPGIKTGFNDCCDADTETVNSLKDQINQMEMIVNVTKAVYYAGQAVLAYQAYSAAVLAGDAFALEAVSATYGADVATVAATSSSATEAATGGIINGFTITPTGVVIAVAIYVALEIFTRGCDADDLFTAALDELGLCYYLEKICTTDTFFGCVQKTKYFCCFDSKLARIIHEQGRPQLQSFAGQSGLFRPTYAEGDYDCRGFTPEEFAMLDFSKINLSEYYGDLQTRINSVIQDDLVDKLQDSAVSNVKVKVPSVSIK